MELLDVYNDKGEVTGKVVKRGSGDEAFGPHEHIAVAIIFIENSKGEFLIQKTSDSKGGLYSSTGGHIDSKERSCDTVIREVKEEIGVDISHDDIVYLGFKTVDFPLRFLYYVKKDIDLDNIVIDHNEVKYVRYMSVPEIEKLISEGLMNKGHALMFNEILNYKKGLKNEERN